MHQGEGSGSATAIPSPSGYGDGNKPLHEWTYHTKDRLQAVVDQWGRVSKDCEEPVSVDNLITWVFEEGTFKLAAKITMDKAYSIITNVGSDLKTGRRLIHHVQRRDSCFTELGETFFQARGALGPGWPEKLLS